MAKNDILLRLNRKQAAAVRESVIAAIAQGKEDLNLRIANMKLTKVMARHDEKNAPRFPNVGCSQCGQTFGPGDHGFSHCENHKGLGGTRR